MMKSLKVVFYISETEFGDKCKFLYRDDETGEEIIKLGLNADNVHIEESPTTKKLKRVISQIKEITDNVHLFRSGKSALEMVNNILDNRDVERLLNERNS